MDGQWHGRHIGTDISGADSGIIVIDVDHCGSHYSGSGTVFNDAGLPGSFVSFRTRDTKESQDLRDLDILAVDPHSALLTDRATLAERYATDGFPLELPKKANVKLDLIGDSLRVTWTTDLETSGSAILSRSGATLPSQVVADPKVQSWSDFKRVACELERGRYIFRGQPSTWRLRTSFHRTNRKDLFRFMAVDIPKLQQVLSSHTTHYFNLQDNQQNGAFWNLVQHHGYPTPLLDWSHSPFVAAFFAYRNKLKDDETAPKVRIYAFDRSSWLDDYRQLTVIAPCMPHFSIIECLALENPRMVPQQALSSVTNIDDIEAYLLEKQEETSKNYLSAYDLPASDVYSVMDELGMMGITAGSLFPGLDGVCEEWRYRMFGYRN